MRIHWVILLSVLTLPGCSTPVPADPGKGDTRTPEQLRAAASDRGIVVTCQLVNSPWGAGRNTYAAQDKGAIVSGNIRVNADCTMDITSEQKALPKGVTP